MSFSHLGEREKCCWTQGSGLLTLFWCDCTSLLLICELDQQGRVLGRCYSGHAILQATLALLSQPVLICCQSIQNDTFLNVSGSREEG
uniref:Uncharacterized protein n=1 Tax=Scophthalmus maximus TaxID=52904 RepID=A0A8D3DIP4_SCOMX